MLYVLKKLLIFFTVIKIFNFIILFIFFIVIIFQYFLVYYVACYNKKRIHLMHSNQSYLLYIKVRTILVDMNKL